MPPPPTARSRGRWWTTRACLGVRILLVQPTPRALIRKNTTPTTSATALIAAADEHSRHIKDPQQLSRRERKK
jgi:hypothetical protein